ncbi:MAG: hypothetical protein JO197_13160 [Acidobacteria bacterium]|nr:hypothetical protein [Acidobacteriota bacterium]MBV9477643.1 hypothetical protein [Acidobacteriota bacterium]
MVSPALLQFIRRCVDSIETLEILLLLQRTPETFWTPAAIDSQLGMKQGAAAKRLARLADEQLVVTGSSGAFRYAPRDEEDRATVAALTTAYADQRASVVNAVFSENLERLRAFSDAFRMKDQ